ncbi:MAG: tetratricopeptide repeat protein [Planctomycetota bacterium]|jgi:tetratricopeptide (TPR) repeat protein
MKEQFSETRSGAYNFRANLAVALVLASLIALAYAKAVGGEFVFDDIKIVRDNTAIREFDVGGILGRTFDVKTVEQDPTQTDPGYRPVRMLSYAIDAAIAGRDALGRPLPVVFHITNIFIHFLNAFLVYLLMGRIFRTRYISVIGALLFALHPVQTEAVTYISGRKDVLFTLFYLIGLLAFITYRRGGSWVWAPAALFTYVLSFFSKEMAITFPAACLAYDLVTRLSKQEDAPPILSRRSVVVYSQLVAAGIALSVFALFIKNPGEIGASTPYLGGSLAASVGTMGRVICHYLRLILLPFGLCVDYSYNVFPASSGLFAPWTTLPAWGLLVALLFSSIALLWRRHIFAFGIMFFFIALLPVSGLVAHPEPIAERFLYLPLFGIVVAALGLLRPYLESYEGKVTFGVFISLVLIFYLIQTERRNRDWKTPLSLYKSAVEVYPDCARMQIGLAGEMRKRDDLPGAHRHFSEALRILESAPLYYPREKGYFLQALNSRAVTAIALECYAEGKEDLEKLLGMRDVFGTEVRTSPKYRHLHYFLGEANYGLGRTDDAEKAYESTITLLESSGKPLDRYTHSAFTRYIRLALRRGDSETADSVWRRMAAALENPLKMDQSLDIMLKFLTRLLEAGENNWADRARIWITPLVRKAKNDPDLRELVSARLWETAQVLHKEKYRFRTAAALYEDMAAMDPGDPRPLLPLGVCYRQLGDFDRAEMTFRKLKEMHILTKEQVRKVEAEIHATVEQRKKRIVQARPTLDKADSLLKAAYLSYENKENAEAEKELEKVFETVADLPATPSVAKIEGEAWMLRTRIAYDSGNAAAVEYARKGLDSLARALENPDLGNETASRLWAWSAELYEIDGKTENAASAWAKALKHDPALPRLRHRLALACLKLGEGVEAVGAENKFNVLAFETLVNAAELFPNYMPTKMNFLLAQASLRINRYDVTIRAASAFVAEADPEDEDDKQYFAPALVMAARAYIGIHDLDKATEALENAETMAAGKEQKAEIEKLRRLIHKARGGK